MSKPLRQSRHWRFVLAFAIGGAIAMASLAMPLGGAVRALLWVDTFAVAYLVLMWRLARSTTPADLRAHARDDDEGIVLILVLALVMVLVSLTAIFTVLNQTDGGIGLISGLLTLGAVPLGWGMVHTLIGFHYSFLYYARKPVGGLKFPGATEPGPWDFLYFAFGIGMTAQVSDVTVTISELRAVVLQHAVGSFFYNAVILALAVNAGAKMAG